MHCLFVFGTYLIHIISLPTPTLSWELICKTFPPHSHRENGDVASLPACCLQNTHSFFLPLCFFCFCVIVQNGRIQETGPIVQEEFILKCYVCAMDAGEGGTAFQTDCLEGITYLPQVEGIYDLGGLYCCGPNCVTWLVKMARKYGFQTNLLTKYGYKDYNDSPEHEWAAAVRNTKNFIRMVVAKEAEEKQKKKVARAAEKRKREQEEARIQQRLAASATQPKVTSTSPTVVDLANNASAAASAVSASDGPDVNLGHQPLAVTTAISLLQSDTSRMRRVIKVFSSVSDYGGGTISDAAEHVLTFHINRMDERIHELKSALGMKEDDSPASKKLKKS